MYAIVQTSKPFAQAAADLQAAVARNAFAVLHVHDIAATLRGKGVPFAEECRVLEICNPKHAARVLAADLRLNMALPCRVSVYTDNGRTLFGMIRPLPMLAALSDDPDLAEVAREVEQAVLGMMDQAR